MTMALGARFFENESGKGAPAVPAAKDTPAPAETNILTEALKGISDNPAELKFIEDQLKNDTEYVEAVKKNKKADKKPAEKKADETPEETPAEDANLSDAGKEKPAEAPAEDDDAPIEFEDNIIEGVSGEEMAALPETVQVSIVKARQVLDAAKREKDEVAAIRAKLEADPIAKDRLKRIEAGETDNLYEVPAIADADITRLQGLIDEGKTEDFKKELVKVASQIAQTTLQNKTLERAASEKVTKSLNDAGSVLLALGKLNKDLVIEMKPEEIISIKPDNKLYAQYKSGVGKIVDEIIQMKNKGIIKDVAGFINESGPEGVYSYFAKKNGWPLVLNADKKINDQIAQSNRDLLKMFSKGNKEHAAPVQGGASAVDKNKAKTMMKEGGVDAVRLAKDTKYHEEVLAMHPYDRDWVDKVAKWRVEGEKKATE